MAVTRPPNIGRQRVAAKENVDVSLVCANCTEEIAITRERPLAFLRSSRASFFNATQPRFRADVFLLILILNCNLKQPELKNPVLDALEYAEDGETGRATPPLLPSA